MIVILINIHRDFQYIVASSNLDVMVVCFTGDSGLTDYSVCLCQELSNLHKVRLVTSKTFDSSKYGTSLPVVKLFRRTRYFLFDFWRFLFYVVRNRPNVILFQSWLKWPAFEAPWLLFFRLIGIRVALTIHDILPHYPRPWSRFECGLYYKSANSLIVHSENQLQALKGLGVKKTPLVVPHGIYDIFNTNSFSRENARKFFPRIGEFDFLVLFFGHLDERKGLVDFLQAAALLQTDNRFKFIVAGKPDNRPRTAAALEFGRTISNVLVYDHMIPHEEVQIFFSACDLVALPYKEGTTSGVMKLAMAFKKPVVCTDVGDFAESLCIWPGILINKIDLPDSLVSGLITACDSYETLQGAVSSSNEKVQWPNIAKKYAEHIFVNMLQ